MHVTAAKAKDQEKSKGREKIETKRVSEWTATWTPGPLEILGFPHLLVGARIRRRY